LSQETVVIETRGYHAAALFSTVRTVECGFIGTIIVEVRRVGLGSVCTRGHDEAKRRESRSDQTISLRPTQALSPPLSSQGTSIEKALPVMELPFLRKEQLRSTTCTCWRKTPDSPCNFILGSIAHFGQKVFEEK
jgi:hypothetical protein